MIFKAERGNYLNDEQKSIKADIVIDILKIFSAKVEVNKDKFEGINFLDLILSVTIVTSSEMIDSFLRCYIREEDKEYVVSEITEAIKTRTIEVMNRKNEE